MSDQPDYTGSEEFSGANSVHRSYETNNDDIEIHTEYLAESGRGNGVYIRIRSADGKYVQSPIWDKNMSDLGSVLSSAASGLAARYGFDLDEATIELVTVEYR